MMKTVLISINTIMLGLAAVWSVTSKFDYEPLIASLTLVATLVGLLYSKRSDKNLKIEGNNNEVRQEGDSSTAEIKGDSNKIFQ